jgi:RNA polymerase sigma-70 factor (ECF subfamily)
VELASDSFSDHRQLLVGVAYRILGRVADAEDIGQDAWLRWAGVDHSTVVDPKAFLVRMTGRLALDRLRRIKARREDYVGPWLPEPLLTSPDVAEQVEVADSVSFAMLVVLQTLSPLERAVFVLREAFGSSHAEIAETLGKSEAAVRQLANRARAHVEAGQPRYESDLTTRRQVTEKFLAASTGGDLSTLMGVLAPGVTLIADGGGKVRAPRLPVHGADTVARFLLAGMTEAALALYLRLAPGEPLPAIRLVATDLVGGPGIVVIAGDKSIAAFVLDVADGLVHAVYLVANPDKLAGIENTLRR